MVVSIALPRQMRIGGGSSGEIGNVLEGLGLSRPLIVTDRFLFDLGLADRLSASLTYAGATDIRIFSDTIMDPTAGSIDRGVSFLRAGRHDCVIGFGGGSVIDSAKAIAVLGRLGGAMRDYKMPHVQDDSGLPIIAIPTTAGTGSEVTRFTIITDEATSEKMLCAGLAYLPVAAIIDYELTLTKPKRLTADTGVDALTHAIEAYVSRRANVLSDAMALAAMRAIGPNLRIAYDEPDNRLAREAIMIGATQAGMAFSNASVALVHGMSRPIGAHFHVPHGLSNAMLLHAVTAFSAQTAVARYATCARAMKIAREAESDQSAVARLLVELKSINSHLAAPSPAAYGIDKAKWDSLLDTMVAQALASGSPANNPRVPTAAEIKLLYEEVYF